MSRQRNRILLLAMLAIVGLMGAGQASAGIITFEGHGNDGTPVQSQDGFQFTFVAQGWGIFEDSFVGGGDPWTHNGTTRLVASGDLPQVTVVPLDGLPFSLGGFDAATLFPEFPAGQIRVTGQFVLGGSISQLVDLTNIFAPVSLSGFSALSSVNFQETIGGAFRTDPGFSLDNLQVNLQAESVPEPGTILLIGGGLLGLAARRRRTS